jgi:hypothetical protein
MFPGLPESCSAISQDPFRFRYTAEGEASTPDGGEGREVAWQQTGALVFGAYVDDTTLGLVPIGSNDIWLHAEFAVGFAYIGFAARDTTAHARV